MEGARSHDKRHQATKSFGRVGELRSCMAARHARAADSVVLNSNDGAMNYWKCKDCGHEWRTGTKEGKDGA
jgi:hypothetical protein